MGQVPRSRARKFTRFLIVGSGRAARHFAEYFRLMQLPFERWARPDGPFAARVGDASHVVIAISDRAILPFAAEHAAALANRETVHLSGALSDPSIHGAHPLMTFGDGLYSLATYKSIWFATEKGRAALDELLPGLGNRSFAIAPEDKPLYHAWCAMSGNFTAMLWSKFFERLEKRFEVPREAAFPYLLQQAENLRASGDRAITGPLARGDRETVDKHLRALEGDSFQFVYDGFAAAYAAEKGDPR